MVLKDRKNVCLMAIYPMMTKKKSISIWLIGRAQERRVHWVHLYQGPPKKWYQVGPGGQRGAAESKGPVSQGGAAESKGAPSERGPTISYFDKLCINAKNQLSNYNIDEDIILYVETCGIFVSNIDKYIIFLKAILQIVMI